jgi:hypothetical protein
MATIPPFPFPVPRQDQSEAEEPRSWSWTVPKLGDAGECRHGMSDPTWCQICSAERLTIEGGNGR